jgi:hypothetical protein
LKTIIILGIPPGNRWAAAVDQDYGDRRDGEIP